MDRFWGAPKELWTHYALPHIKKHQPFTRIGVSNLKDEIEKANIAKFLNNVKDLLGYKY